MATSALGNLVDGTPDELTDILSHLRRKVYAVSILDLRRSPGGAIPDR